MKKNILIIEDEEKLALVLSDYLKQAGFKTSILGNGLEVIPRVREDMPDLMILDLMLPGRDGIDICKDIRSFSNLPIIMLTARVEEIDRLLGLELGADDYICKPFSPREVVARVKAVLRRAGGVRTLQSERLLLDESRYEAVFDGNVLNLTAVEFNLLKVLASNPGRVYSRDLLMEHIYSDRRIVSDRTIDSHIKKLRMKMAKMSDEVQPIKSVYGVGYKFEW
jgi:two-component system response regulator BaeR